jgi:phospholipid/cholesterol/gamma-HCH transport system ATP-binding protein
MIEFKSVSLSFDGRQILENISFTLKAGETMVILGGSGSGKTTILRLILGLIHPDSGDILIEGRSIVDLSEQEMTEIRVMMALVFQHAALFDSLTVRENVGYRFWEKDLLDDEEIEQRVIESLRFVGLDDITSAMPAELSGGMRKRVAIARAVASNPRVILYDEPTAGLDPINTHIISGLIRRLQTKERVTQVVVTHDIDTAYHVSDHLIMIQRGEKIFEGTVAALKGSKDQRVQGFLNPHDGLAHKDESFGLPPEITKELPR